MGIKYSIENIFDRLRSYTYSARPLWVRSKIICNRIYIAIKRNSYN